MFENDRARQLIVDMSDVVRPLNSEAAATLERLSTNAHSRFVEHFVQYFAHWLSGIEGDVRQWVTATPPSTVEVEAQKIAAPCPIRSRLSRLVLSNGDGLSQDELVKLVGLIGQHHIDIDSEAFGNKMATLEQLSRERVLEFIQPGSGSEGIDDQITYRCYAFCTTTKSLRQQIQRLSKQVIFLRIENIRATGVSRRDAIHQVARVMRNMEGKGRHEAYHIAAVRRLYNVGQRLNDLGAGSILVVPSRMGRLNITSRECEAIAKYIGQHSYAKSLKSIWLCCMRKLSGNIIDEYLQRVHPDEVAMQQPQSEIAVSGNAQVAVPEPNTARPAFFPLDQNLEDLDVAGYDFSLGQSLDDHGGFFPLDQNLGNDDSFFPLDQGLGDYDEFFTGNQNHTMFAPEQLNESCA